MELIQGIKERRSVRNFTKEKISHELFESIVEVAKYAPSWKNGQCVRYTLIESPTLLEKIATNAVLSFSYNTDTILKAPNLVIVSTVNKRSGYEKDGTFSTSKADTWEVFDAGIAAQTFCLAAHGFAVGSVIMGIFDDQKIKEYCELPDNQTVAAIIAIGKPITEPQTPPRKNVEDITSYR